MIGSPPTQVKKHPLYATWRGMRQRCISPTCKDYPHYGGRGIRVCERWLNSFNNFVADMGPRPSNKHTIDRIDNSKDYEPGNVRWATRAEQSLNRRCTRFRTINGVTKSRAQWAAERRAPRPRGEQRGTVAVGMRFGRLVVGESVRRGKGIRWACLCDCGGRCEQKARYLLTGKAKSCGCLYRKFGREKDANG